MKFWRLSSRDHARKLDGGYGLNNLGRWNSLGVPVTYASTTAALCVLEKLVHIESPDLLPDDLVFVEYGFPDELECGVYPIESLPSDWLNNPARTRAIGDGLLQDSSQPAVIVVPSVMLRLENAPDRNVVVNHASTDIAALSITQTAEFSLDPRLVAF